MKDTNFWARQIKTPQELPESFTAFFETLQYPNEFPYMVFAPPDKSYHKKTTPKLLVLQEDRIWIAEKHKKQIETTCFLFQDINYIETGMLLLQSWMKINGIIDGQTTTITVEYNTVSESFFKPIIAKIRTTIYNLGTQDFINGQHKKELSKFDVLMKTSFKYMNYGKHSLLPGERLHRFIFQPDIRVTFLKFFQRVLTFTHLAILTDHELILIKDDDSLKPIRRIEYIHHIRYGGIWRYIPISKVIEIKIEDVPTQGIVKLTVLFQGGIVMSSLFSLFRRPELEALIHNIDGSGLIEKECV